MIDFDQICF